MITFEEFFAKHNGRFEEYNNDQYKFQCMDLFWLYLKEVLGVDPRPYQGWGTAKNCDNNFSKIKDANKHFTRIKNGPVNYPTKGDIVWWGYYPFVTGFAGHVAICTAAGPMRFVSFDQNYGSPLFCKLTNHNYKGVQAWRTPKKGGA